MRPVSSAAEANESGPFRALEFDFAVRSTDQAVRRYLDRVLRPLAVADGGVATHTYWVVTGASSGECWLTIDDELLVNTAAPEVAVAYLLWDVNRRAVAASSSRYLLVHAAAAEFGDSAVLLPAAMESGKTTLVAGLVEAGLGYLTDEVVAVDPETLVVSPYPKALSLDPGSWAVLHHLKPDLDATEASYAGNQWQVDPDTIRPGAVGVRCPPGFVIVPRYEAGSATSVAPLPATEAVAVLAQNSFNLTEHGRVAIESYAAIVRRSRCLRLTVGDLGEACRLVLSLLREPASGT